MNRERQFDSISSKNRKRKNLNHFKNFVLTISLCIRTVAKLVHLIVAVLVWFVISHVLFSHKSNRGWCRFVGRANEMGMQQCSWVVSSKIVTYNCEEWMIRRPVFWVTLQQDRIALHMQLAAAFQWYQCHTVCVMDSKPGHCLLAFVRFSVWWPFHFPQTMMIITLISFSAKRSVQWSKFLKSFAYKKRKKNATNSECSAPSNLNGRQMSPELRLILSIN